MSISACRFRVAGAALSAHSFRICVAGAAFCDVAKVESKIVAGTAFCDVFEKWRKHRKSHSFSPVYKLAYKKNSKEIVDFHLPSARWTSFWRLKSYFVVRSSTGWTSFCRRFGALLCHTL